jgi:hypothetical protein
MTRQIDAFEIDYSTPAPTPETAAPAKAKPAKAAKPATIAPSTPPADFEIDYSTPADAAPAPVAPVAVVEEAPAAPVTDEVSAMLATAVAEGQIAAAGANLVRGGVPRANVNAIAGFQSAGGVTAAQAGAAASFGTARSAAMFGQTEGATIAAPAAPSTWVPSTPLATDLPAPLRAAIVAARARRGIDTAKLTPAQQRAAAAAETRERQRRAVESAITVALTAAGGEYAHGCLAAWRPAGERPHAVLVEVAAAAGVEPPAKRSPRAVASDAVRALEASGYRVAVRAKGSEWAVYRPTDVAAVGQSVGEAGLIASFVDDNLKLEGPEHLCAAVRGVWEEAQKNAVVGSTEITAWLAGICHDLLAVPTAYGRWIAPGESTEKWRRLATAAAAAKLPVPARPAAVATREDICDEIRVGIVAEVAALIGEIKTQRDTYAKRGAAAAAGKEIAKDLGMRAALTRLDEIAALRSKIETYEGLIGRLDDERAELTALEEELAPMVDPTFTRGAMLEMD